MGVTKSKLSGAAVGGAEERDTHGGHITQWPVGFVQVFATFFRVVLESRGMM